MRDSMYVDLHFGNCKINVYTVSRGILQILEYKQIIFSLKPNAAANHLP